MSVTTLLRGELVITRTPAFKGQRGFIDSFIIITIIFTKRHLRNKRVDFGHTGFLNAVTFTRTLQRYENVLTSKARA